MKSSSHKKKTGSNQIIIEKVYAFREDTPSTQPNLVQLNCPEPVLREFRYLLEGTPILGCTYYNPYTQQIDTIPIDADQLTSLHLQVLARNESVNVDGKMCVDLYQGLLNSDQIARLRCLVKATNVAGLVYATHTGGYRGELVELLHPAKTIVIDQAGLQWQRDFRNTGGMHFYPENNEHIKLPEGYALWQQQMFLAMYGKVRPLEPSERTMDVTWKGLRGKLDLKMISNALAVEFSQALDAAVNQGNIELEQQDVINFKFMRAVMGFFASGLDGDMHQLRVARLQGIELALQQIARLPQSKQQVVLGKIGRIILPHSNDAPYTDEVLARIQTLVEGLGLVWGGAPEEDPFLLVEGYVNATTNCADPHAMIGNEGGYSSVDASISCNANLNNHNAAYNNTMQPRVSPAFVFSTDSQYATARLTHFKSVSTASETKSSLNLKKSSWFNFGR